jgi:hypothetical protein
LANMPVIREGWLELPGGPGLGVALGEDLSQHFPYMEGNYYVTVER